MIPVIIIKNINFQQSQTMQVMSSNTECPMNSLKKILFISAISMYNYNSNNICNLFVRIHVSEQKKYIIT